MVKHEILGAHALEAFIDSQPMQGSLFADKFFYAIDSKKGLFRRVKRNQKDAFPAGKLVSAFNGGTTPGLFVPAEKANSEIAEAWAASLPKIVVAESPTIFEGNDEPVVPAETADDPVPAGDEPPDPPGDEGDQL